VKVSAGAQAGLSKLRRSLVLAWTIAWVLGLGVFVGIAAQLNAKLEERSFDAELALFAGTAYGLAWFDEGGGFHGEVLAREPGFLGGSIELWILEQAADGWRVQMGPNGAQLPALDVRKLARMALEEDAEFTRDGLGPQGQLTRNHVIPTYRDGDGETPIAAIIAVGDPARMLARQAGFRNQLLLAAGGLGLLGLLVAIGLAHWSARPLAQALARGERFLATAAHELRTPVAALRAVAESAQAGGEAPELALERIAKLARSTSQIVDELLVYAQLDAGAAALALEPLRLDLFLESLLPEGLGLELETEECVVQADPRLLGVALGNLLANAQRHAGAQQGGLRIRVTAACVSFEDRGPGFPGAILRLARQSMAAAPSSHGAGIGLASVQMIAELHGGRLELSNRDAGGARACFYLGQGATVVRPAARS